MGQISSHDQRPLGVLTGAKAVSNVALRWIGPFLPTLERAFGASTSTMTSVMGAAELLGLNTAVSGRYIDRGHERRMVLVGLWAVAISSLAALVGNLTAFALSFGLVIIGVGNLTVAAHAWISHRVPFEGRGRAIGILETSWALALLLGAPVMAALLWVSGWRGAYIGLAAGATVSAFIVHRAVPRDEVRGVSEPGGAPHRLPGSAYLPMIAAAAIAAGGIGLFVISGSWLTDTFDASTTTLGLVAAGLGGAELVSSSTVASISDRVGTRRSVIYGLMVFSVGIATMALSGDSFAVAVAGLIVAMAGFEYAFVSSLTLVTEAAPDARGKAIGVSAAFGTVARSAAVVATGLLYDQFGFGASLLLTLGAIGLAVVTLAVSGEAGLRPKRWLRSH
jgi:DHA1 family inner membrane transport protein